MSRESRVLDVGCGTGRLPIGILRELGGIRAYWGLDVNASYIRWCRRHLERAHPGFRFAWIDVKNARYSPDAEDLQPDFRFPFQDKTFDAIYLYSVFSHMNTGDVRIYLNEFRRLIAPAGRLFFTAFAEENVPRVSVNPAGYRRDWSGPLHCVRYERTFLTSLLDENGFVVDQSEYATEIDGQSAFYCTLR